MFSCDQLLKFYTEEQLSHYAKHFSEQLSEATIITDT